MKATFLDLDQTNLLPEIVKDYLADEKFLRPFYAFRPEISEFEKVIAQKKKQQVNREVLVQALMDQYRKIFEKKIPENALIENKIKLLKSENTFTITTGHQLNIFTGPLYFIYKIISAIKLADVLNEKYPEFNFISVYWMASEDHDLEEINHIHLFGKKITWNTNQSGACGRMKTESLAKVIDELKEILGEGKNAEFLIKLFSDAYLENENLADATRYIVHSLFGKYGLVILDGDDAMLKKEYIPEMKSDLLEHAPFKKANEASQQLSGKYKVQVHPREVNLFLLEEGLRGRVEVKGLEFKVQGLTDDFSESDILNMLDSHPEKFSPNVVLRPLYQEKVLPNLAMVGGPAEVSYWLQYKSMFDYFGIAFPVLVLRSMILWLDEVSSSRMKNLGITPEKLFHSEDELIKKYVSNHAASEISLSDELKKLEAVFEGIKPKTTDESMFKSIEGEKQKAIKQLKNLEAKLIRAEKKNHETAIQQIRNLKEKFFPGNSFQERHENLIPYYLKHGEKFFGILMKDSTLFNKQLPVISEKDS